LARPAKSSNKNPQNWTFELELKCKNLRKSLPEKLFRRSPGPYISEPRPPRETDRPFSEPGLFVINPQGQVQIVDISNAPFARPDLTGILNGVKFVREKDYPIRGTLS
jgi:hypothetical protein